MAKARENLLKIFNMPEVLMFASSGTGAMEASVVNLCHKKLLTINGGKFGERFTKIAESHGLKVRDLKYEWDTPAKVEDVLKALKESKDIDAIAIQISESFWRFETPS